jgi:ADP-ribose pyrophosphatase YjhB (NUDIX family)
VILNALVRDESGAGLVVVRQAVPHAPVPRWAVPGGKVNPGESVHDALACELSEEIALAYAGTVAHASALGAGPVAWPDPEGDVQVVELVPLATAIDRLSGTPSRWHRAAHGKRSAPVIILGRTRPSGRRGLRPGPQHSPAPPRFRRARLTCADAPNAA